MSSPRRTKKSLEVIPKKLVTLTAEAVEKMREALKQFSGTGIRIKGRKNKRGDVSFSLDVEDEAHADDLVFEDSGITFLVDPSTTQHIQGSEIRYVTTQKGTGFSIVTRSSGG